MGDSYLTLAVQPIDLIRAFKVDFCLASVIKWLTKWHMERKSEFLQRAGYYVDLCESGWDKKLYFALRMYCIVNGFMKDNFNSTSCLLVNVVSAIMIGQPKEAHREMNYELANEQH